MYNNEATIKENERIDDLQIKGFKIIQDISGFCFGMDAVLLSHYAHIKKKSRILDMCSGTAIIPLLMTALYEDISVKALEIQESLVDMAMRSIKLNNLNNIDIIKADIKNIRELIERESFDYVTCNPPYMTESHGLTNPNMSKAVSRHEILCDLNDVIQGAAWSLKTNGHFLLVHRPFRLAEIMYKLKLGGLEPKRMRLVYPYVDKEPNIVLIDAVKNGRERITVEPPLIVYEKDGRYTRELLGIYSENGNYKI